MQLLLDEKTLRKGWSSAFEYWFSHRDYTVKAYSDMPSFDKPDGISQTAFFMQQGYIPFFTLSNEEVIRKYIESTNKSKLIATFSSLSGPELVETFWKYFNAYKDISKEFPEFEKSYLLKKAVSWCEENGIEYKTA